MLATLALALTLAHATGGDEVVAAKPASVQPVVGFFLGGAMGAMAGAGVGLGVAWLQCAPHVVRGVEQSSCGIEPDYGYLTEGVGGAAIGALAGAVGGIFLGIAADDANAAHADAP